MKQRIWISGVAILCLVILLIVFTNVSSRVREIVKPVILVQSHTSQFNNPFNKIIKFIQLPSSFPHKATVYLKGQKPPLKAELIIHPPGDTISDYARRGALWESDNIDSLLQYMLKHSELQFVDIGSNIGLYTLSVASIQPNKRHIVAVDANERNCQFLAQSMKMNGLGDHVIIINNAIDVNRTEDTLYFTPDNVGGGFVQGKDQSMLYNEKHTQMKIHSIHFDDLLDVITFREAVLKMDIEGAENRALKEAQTFFRTMKIPAILMEWRVSPGFRSKEQYDGLVTYFSNLGYDPYNSLRSNRQMLSRDKHSTWPIDVVWLLKGYNH